MIPGCFFFQFLIAVKKLVEPYPTLCRSFKEEGFFDPVSKEVYKFPSIKDPYSVHLSVIVPAYNEAQRCLYIEYS